MPEANKMDDELVYKFKVAVGGKGGVGKTTFIHRYVSNEFISDTKMTIGVQFHIKELAVEKNGMPVNVNMILWDLGGQQRFRFIMPTYLKGTAGALVLFDMSRYESLVEAKEWFDLFKVEMTRNEPILLVGTKMDIISDEDAELIKKAAIEYAAEQGYAGYAFTSSASGTNVIDVMNYLARSVLDNCSR